MHSKLTRSSEAQDLKTDKIMSGSYMGNKSFDQFSDSASYSASPIKLFGQAKVRIAEVFDEIKRYTVNSDSLICAGE